MIVYTPGYDDGNDVNLYPNTNDKWMDYKEMQSLLEMSLEKVIDIPTNADIDYITCNDHNFGNLKR